MNRFVYLSFFCVFTFACLAETAEAKAPKPRETHTLFLPAAGYVSSQYGLRKIPKKRGARMHWGIDIHTSHGATVVAACEGTVCYVGNRGGYGNLVDIDHGGGLITRYAHLESFNVAPGDKVTLGQQIGHVGDTGHTTGPNLHFEARVLGRPVDPLPFLLTDVPVKKRTIVRSPLKLTPTVPYRPGVVMAR